MFISASQRRCQSPDEVARRSFGLVRCDLLLPSIRLPPLCSLLALLLPLPLDVDLPLLAPDFRALPLELVAVDLQLVLDGELVIHELPHGGERQSTVLQFHVLEVRLLLVRPAHRPGKFVPVLLDRQGGRQLQPTDLVLAIPRPDGVCLVALRARKAAEPEYQRCRKDRLHDHLRNLVETNWSNESPSSAADSDSMDAATVGRPQESRLALPSRSRLGRTTRSLALARRRRHREAFLNPRLPQRRFAGDGSGRLIAVEVEVERHHDRAREGHDAQGGDAWPRLVEPQQGAVRTLADVLHHAAKRRDACRNGPALPRARAAEPQSRGQRRPGLLF